MWQSSGKYVPTVEQLKEIAPAIIDMGCFARMETNGGEVEQINLLFGENPMASRVANEMALKYDKSNHILQYCMVNNVSGVIGPAVAVGD